MAARSCLSIPASPNRISSQGPFGAQNAHASKEPAAGRRLRKERASGVTEFRNNYLSRAL